MNMHDYQKLAQRTSPADHDKQGNGILGLIGEVGELVDEFKKYIYQSGPDPVLPAMRFAEECGDVLWYLAELAEGMGVELAQIAPDFDILDEKAAGLHGAPSLRSVLLDMSKAASDIASEVLSCRMAAAQENMRVMLRRASWLARIIGVPLVQIAHMNIEKLKKRYPDGFEASISMARYE